VLIQKLKLNINKAKPASKTSCHH